MEFHPIRAEDQEIIQEYFKQIDSRNCDMCFSTTYLWREFYGLSWSQEGDMLIIKTGFQDEAPGFYFPIGSADPERALTAIETWCEENRVPVRLYCVSRDHEKWLDIHRPSLYQVTYNRDVEDYVYEREKLVRLSGRKYHGKKKHVNKFKRAFPDWTYEPITDANRRDCLEMLREWKKINSVEEDIEKHAESCVARNYLLHLEMLGQKGGAIRAQGRIVAFTVGEKINSDTFVVHIEKAFSDVPGAYAIVNQQFLEHEAGDCFYVNREDDAGEEGLRQAKVSYHPVFMIEKGMAYRSFQ